MNSINTFSSGRRLCSALLVGTCIGALAAPALAQDAQPVEGQPPATQPPAAGSAPAEAPASPLFAPGESGVVQTISVVGNQRLEAETVISYMPLRVGDTYTTERLDEALRALLQTELFADVRIRADQGTITVEVRENPVVNRIILEGNKRLKEDKINPEIRLAPRQIFTRSKVRADVARIIELYRRQGRFAAEVEPQIVQLDQNRVDVIFEISEGPRSKVRQINILGNEVFSDSELRSQMVTKQSRLFRIFSSNDVYDPDRLAYDQQKLRLFYLTEGYADFRVVSAVAELTPDKRDFIITYVVEEGERYKFGEVKAESEIRDLPAEAVEVLLPMETGDWYDAKLVEDTITSITESAGLFGYAFAEVSPDIQRNPEERTMDVTFQVQATPRVYVERIDIAGNTQTRDKVIRREFRLSEGDPFNSLRVKRSRDRIQSLGFFQENLEIQQNPGSTPDRVILAVNVEERSTGELQVSAGFSSIERFLVNLSITQRNFMGKGQTLTAGINYSSYSKSVELGFTEPYLFDQNIALGGSIYRRDYNSFNYIGNERNTTYEQVTTGMQLRMGAPITEYLSFLIRYGLNHDDVTLDPDLFYSDPDGAGPLPPQCDPLRAGRYLCDAIGKRVTSSLGYSLIYDTLDNRLRPRDGEQILVQQDFAGLGGDVSYLRTRASARSYYAIGGSNFIFSASLEGGFIHSFDDQPRPGADAVRLTDRFFLGEPQIRGFDIRGVGPRVQRTFLTLDAQGNPIPVISQNQTVDDALGGRAYYLGRLEVEIPLGTTGSELGLRPSVFMDVGALWGLEKPILQAVIPGPIVDSQGRRQCIGSGTVTPIGAGESCPANTTLAVISSGFIERYVGDTHKPRLSVGFGVNWNSPFGPFRIDIAKALRKAEGDDTKLITFNVGTAF